MPVWSAAASGPRAQTPRTSYIFFTTKQLGRWRFCSCSVVNNHLSKRESLGCFRRNQNPWFTVRWGACRSEKRQQGKADVMHEVAGCKQSGTATRWTSKSSVLWFQELIGYYKLFYSKELWHKYCDSNYCNKVNCNNVLNYFLAHCTVKNRNILKSTSIYLNLNCKGFFFFLN